MLLVEVIMINGEKIRTLRKEKGLRQSDLAHAAGVLKQAIGLFENSTHGDPRLSTAVGIARALDVPIEDLIAE